MAARGRILASIFLSFAILPLLTSAALSSRDRSRGILFPGHQQFLDPEQKHHGFGFLKKNNDLPTKHEEEEDDSLPIFLEPEKEKHFGDEDADYKHKDEKKTKEKKVKKEKKEKKEKKPKKAKEDKDETQNQPANGGYGPLPEQKKKPEQKEKELPAVKEPAAQKEEPVKEQGGGNVAGNKGEGLKVGFYEKSCPQTENVVKEISKKIFQKDPTLAPGVVRLFFHDCFVTGCDASVLLDTTPTGDEVEKKASVNGIFVRGYQIIDEIKAKLEEECPGIVSCADILAFTNRESLVYTGVPSYNLAAGRRDGLASLSKNVIGNIPVPETPINEITQIFQKKGFSMEDLVVLTGAHSIGTAHCTVVSGRFFDQEKSMEMDQGYVIKMRPLVMCRNDSQDLPFDPYSQQKMDSRYYKELLEKRALLESDQNLAKDPQANDMMKKLVGDQKGWLEKFTNAIIKLGEVEVLTGDQGQVRKQCRAVNL